MVFFAASVRGETETIISPDLIFIDYRSVQERQMEVVHERALEALRLSAL
jgi:hypothetical protein